MSVTSSSVENPDKSKSLWRAAYVLIKKLDTVYHGGKAIKTVFSYEAYGHRLRLKELLQKLMFMDLGTNFRRTEELIWRKAFYEPYFLYKAYVKNNDQQDRLRLFEDMLVVHILSAVGYYQSLILAVQSDLGDAQPNDFCSWILIALHIPLYCRVFFQFDAKPRLSVANKSAAIKLIHKCLTNIGDLFRYLIDFGDSNAKRLAYRYYKAAFYFDPLMGLPHNQLGILDVGRCYGLNAVFHYLRCLTSRFPFEGAKGNLITVLAKNELRYGMITREKPSRSSRIRYASYFRPKDFRKTIMKFIYLIQQFLKPVESRDPATETIFHDILAELHSSLLLTDHLTVRSETIAFSKHTSTKNLKTNEVNHEKTDCTDETSDQLTGPIFIRMLLISILTYEYTLQLKIEQDRNKPGEKKLDENLDIQGHSAQESEVSTVPTSSDTSGEENAIQIDSSDNCPSAVTNKCESSSVTTIPDLYAPLSFALSIGELYVTHVCSQIYRRLGQFMEDPKGKPVNSGISKTSHNLCTDCPACCDPSNPSGNSNCKHVLNDHRPSSNISSTEHPEAISDLGNPDDELEDSGDIRCTRTQSHESIHSNTDTDEDDDHARLRFRRYSSDEDSQHEFVERATDENDNESDTDFWGSDDSSLLHSQDEINSTGTPTDDDLDVFSDDRLRRASKLNRLGSQRNVKQSKPNDSSKYLSESRSVSKDVQNTLNCISEEEAMQEGKTEKVDVPSPVSLHSSNNDKESVHNDSIVDSEEKNTCYPSKFHSDSIKENLSNHPLVQVDKDSYDANADITTRLSLFSQLYLFSAVKLFLDWLSSSKFEHLNLSAYQDINSTLTDDSTDKSQKRSRASILWQVSVERFISQLMPLLNSIYPIFDQISHEISRENVTNTSKACDINHCYQNEQLNVDSCTHFIESNADDEAKFNIVHHLSPDVYQTMKRLFSQQVLNLNKSPAETQNEVEENSTQQSVIHDEEKFQMYPLPEDWLLLGLPSMNCIHEKIDFHHACISPSLNEIDEIVFRCASIAFHGCSLASYSNQLGLFVTYNSTGDGRRPFKCDIPLSEVPGLSSSNHSNWPYSNRRKRRGRRYQKFYPGYGRCDRYSSSCPNANFQYSRTDNRNTCVPHRGHSYREHARYSGSAKAHKSHYDPRHRNRPSQQADNHHDDWDTTESAQHLTASQSDNLQSVSKSSPQKSDSSSMVKCDTELFSKPQMDSTENDQSRRDQAMRDMARLRLLNEVDQLERQFRNQSPLLSTKRSTSTSSCIRNSESTIQDKNLGFDINKSFLSPFLVLDAYCLTSHLPMVKQLVSSNRFILIIPQAVISHLDYLKKTLASARVAIRYLEHEAHGGNRYLRLQKPDEQPNQPIQLHRQDAVHNDAQDLITDVEEDESKSSSTSQNLNLRVVRRWVNILDCASYFAQTLKDSNKLSESTSSVNSNCLPKQATSSDEHEINGPSNLLNISPPYVDLLTKGCSTDEVNELSTTKTAPVTILIGFRNTSLEDTTVPQSFLTLALNHGVRLEVIRSFIQRWKTMKT